MASVSNFATYPSLRERVVVVTGGANGIGEAIVTAFARQGSRVVSIDVQDEGAARLAERLAAEDLTPPTYLHCDLTDDDAIATTVEQISTHVGAVDVLVNNAGNDTRHTIEEVTPAKWDALMAVNLKHQFFMAQGLLPAMRRAGHGSIINMGSISWAIPSTNVPVYATAKAAIVGLTRALAHEVGADGVRVNCVMPGAIQTERQQRLWLTDAYRAEVLGRQALKRLIEPEEVARLVLFLAADDSAAITNQSYVIDAGWI